MNDLSEKIIAHYERHAAEWDADRRASGWSARKWHDRFTALLHEGASVLDLGCGGGIAGREQSRGTRHARDGHRQLAKPHRAVPRADTGAGMDRGRHARPAVWQDVRRHSG